MNGIAPVEGREFYGKPLILRPGNHRYFWGGEPITSVTTILGIMAKPALIQWAANMAVDHIASVMKTDPPRPVDWEEELAIARKAHTTKKEAAADIGSAVHQYAQDCLRAGKLVELPDNKDVAAACDAFQKWYVLSKIEPIAIERMVMSSALGYAGRCDFFGKIDGELGVLDFKTSAGIYPEHWIQLAAYEVALQEELQLDQPLKRWLLHLDKKTGKFTFKAKDMCPVTIQAWSACVMLNRMLGLMKKLEK
jgi:hypothetical protein